MEDENLTPEADEVDSQLVAVVTFEDNSAKFLWDNVVGLQPFLELENSEEVVDSIKQFLFDALDTYASYGRRSIPVTPEGPFLSGETTDASSVAWALNTLYSGEYSTIGDLPTMKDLGLDYASNFNEDGSPRVR